jgi:hypothetical protein
MKSTAHNALTAVVLTFTLALAASVAQASAFTPLTVQAQLSQPAGENRLQCPGQPGHGSADADGGHVSSHIVKDGQGCTIWP